MNFPVWLRAIERVQIPGKGELHIVQEWRGITDPRNLDGIQEPEDLLGKWVILDENLVKVTAVESFMIARPYPPALPFGIMVSHEDS